MSVEIILHYFNETNTAYSYLDCNEAGYTTSLIETEENSDFSYKYEYDKNGNITKLYTKRGNNYVLTEEYEYDAFGILKDVKYHGRNEEVWYVFDECGNLLFEDFDPRD